MISKYIEWFCDDVSHIENYNEAMADDSQVWVCHHRLETHKYKDRSRTEWVERDENVSPQILKAFGLYFNRPANELIFMTRSDHTSLHTKGKTNDALKGRKFSEDHKRKISEAHKGKHKSKEWRKKISETLKGRPGVNKGKPMSEETKKKLSEVHKGKKLSEEVKQKLRESMLGRRIIIKDGKRVYTPRPSSNV